MACGLMVKGDMGAAEGGWSELRRDVWRRTTRPAAHATFVFFFFGSVVLIGGLGIWVELINAAKAPSPTDFLPVRTAMATFFPALIGSTCFQIVLGKYLKALRAVAFVGTTIIAAVGFWLVLDRNLSTALSLSIGTLASLVSLWFWWIANADNPDFFDEPLDQAALGGSTDRPLGGDLGGFDA